MLQLRLAGVSHTSLLELANAPGTHFKLPGWFELPVALLLLGCNCGVGAMTFFVSFTLLALTCPYDVCQAHLKAVALSPFSQADAISNLSCLESERGAYWCIDTSLSMKVSCPPSATLTCLQRFQFRCMSY